MQFGESVKVENNVVQGNRSDGILIDQPSPATVKNNSLMCNAGSGIIVAGQGKVGQSYITVC